MGAGGGGHTAHTQPQTRLQAQTQPYHPCTRHFCLPACGIPPLQVGEDLTSAYWRPGNGAMFLDLVASLTGRELSADAWVAQLQKPLDTLLEGERVEYDKAVKAGPR